MAWGLRVRGERAGVVGGLGVEGFGRQGRMGAGGVGRRPAADVVAGQMCPERNDDAIRADDNLVLDLIGRNHPGAYNAGSSCSVSCQDLLRGRIEDSSLKAIPNGRYELAVTILVGPTRECPPRVEQPP